MTKEQLQGIIVDCGTDELAKRDVLNWLDVSINKTSESCIRLKRNVLATNPRSWYENELKGSNSTRVVEIISYEEFCGRRRGGQLDLTSNWDELLTHAKNRYRPGMLIRCPFGNAADQIVATPMNIRVVHDRICINTEQYGEYFSIYKASTKAWAEIINTKMKSEVELMLEIAIRDFPIGTHFIDVWKDKPIFRTVGLPYRAGNDIIVDAFNNIIKSNQTKILWCQTKSWATKTTPPVEPVKIFLAKPDMRSLLSKAMTDFPMGCEFSPVGKPSYWVHVRTGSILIAGDDIITQDSTGVHTLYDGVKNQWASLTQMAVPPTPVSKTRTKEEMQLDRMALLKSKYSPGTKIRSAVNDSLEGTILENPEYQWENEEWVTAVTDNGRMSIFRCGKFAEVMSFRSSKNKIAYPFTPDEEEYSAKDGRTEARRGPTPDHTIVRLPAAEVIPPVHKEKKRRILI